MPVTLEIVRSIFRSTFPKNCKYAFNFFDVVLGFYVPPKAKVIRRRDLGLKSHPKDWRSPGSNT